MPPTAHQRSLALMADTFTRSFTVVDGEWVHIRGRNTVTPSSNPPDIRLLDKSGKQVSLSVCPDSTQPQRDCGPLLASGSPYRLQVGRPSGNGTGTFEVYLQRLTAGRTCNELVAPCATPLPSVPTIDRVLDTDLYRFTVADGGKIRVTIAEHTPSGSKFNPVGRLLTGTGKQATKCGFFSSQFTEEFDCGPLPATGNPYRLQIEDFQGNDTGSYSVRVCPLQ